MGACLSSLGLWASRVTLILCLVASGPALSGPAVGGELAKFQWLHRCLDVVGWAALQEGGRSRPPGLLDREPPVVPGRPDQLRSVAAGAGPRHQGLYGAAAPLHAGAWPHREGARAHPLPLHDEEGRRLRAGPKGDGRHPHLDRRPRLTQPPPEGGCSSSKEAASRLASATTRRCGALSRSAPVSVGPRASPSAEGRRGVTAGTSACAREVAAKLAGEADLQSDRHR